MRGGGGSEGVRGGPALGGYGAAGPQARLTYNLVASPAESEELGEGPGRGIAETRGGRGGASQRQALIEEQYREQVLLDRPDYDLSSVPAAASLGRTPSSLGGDLGVRADQAIVAAEAAEAAALDDPRVQGWVQARRAGPAARTGVSSEAEAAAAVATPVAAGPMEPFQQDPVQTFPHSAEAPAWHQRSNREAGPGTPTRPASGGIHFASGSQEERENEILLQFPGTASLLRHHQATPQAGAASESPLPVRELHFTAAIDAGPAALGSDGRGKVPVAVQPPVEVVDRTPTAEPLAVPHARVPEPCAPPSRDLTDYLPRPLARVYERKGVKELHAWQADCINHGQALKGGSLLYCAPTSGGKSIVAEVLLLRRLNQYRRAFVIMVLPLISICEEKVELLEELLAPLGRRVLRNFGPLSIEKNRLPGAETGVIVCTIEKAYNLVNRLMEESRMDLVTMIVIDELHMVGEERRGPNLERMLTSVMHSRVAMAGHVGENCSSLQLVGMSASLPNIGSLGSWLKADVFMTSFRPVKLVKYLVLEGDCKILKVAKEKNGVEEATYRMEECGNVEGVHVPGAGGRSMRRSWDVTASIVAALARECLSAVDRHCVLIFCETKAACKKCCDDLYAILGDPDAGNDAVKQGRKLGSEQCRKTSGLSSCIERGYVFHNSGVDQDEREVVEELFRSKVCRVLAATTSLAIGVNLPARRVIIRKPYLGRPDTFLDGIKFDQMAGRAGRAGIDTLGEAFLLFPEILRKEYQRAVNLMTKGPEKVLSMLERSRQRRSSADAAEPEIRGDMLHVMNGAICTGMVASRDDVKIFLDCTMTGCSTEVSIDARDSLGWLCMRGFIRWTEEEGDRKYEPQVLGLAVNASGMPPQEALSLKEELDHARKYGIVLDDDVHLLYFCVPWNFLWKVNVNWENLKSLYEGGDGKGPERIVMERLGLDAGFLSHPHQKGRTAQAKRRFNSLRIRAERFYMALILRELAHETPLSEMRVKFQVSESILKNLQEDASMAAHSVAIFCERMDYLDMVRLLENLQARIAFGVKHDILVLAEIPNITAARARQLYSRNIRTPEDIVRKGKDSLAQILAGNGKHVGQKHKGVATRILKGAIDWCKHKIVEEEAKQAELKKCIATPQSLGRSGPDLSLGVGRITNSTVRASGVTQIAKRASSGLVDPTTSKRARISTAGAAGQLSPGRMGVTMVGGAALTEKILSEARTKWKKFSLVFHCEKKKSHSFGFPRIGSLPPSGNLSEGYSLRGVAIAARLKVPGGGGGDLGRAGPLYYVPYAGEGGAPPKHWLGFLNELLFCTAEKYTYNLKDQFRVLLHACLECGVDPAPFHKAVSTAVIIDVLLMRWMSDPGAMSANHVLEVPDAAKGIVDDNDRTAAVKETFMSSKGLNGGHQRACRDAYLCLHMQRTLLPKLVANHLWKPLKLAEIPVVSVLSKIEHTGVPFSDNRLDEMADLVQKRLRKLQSKVDELLAPAAQGRRASIKISERLALSEKLFRSISDGGLGLPPPELKTKAAQRTLQFPTNKEALQEVRQKLRKGFDEKSVAERGRIEKHCVLLDAVSEHRSLSKLLENLQSLPQFAIKIPGLGRRLVTNFLQTSSKTGRIMTDEPNLQCLQKETHFQLSQSVVGVGGGDGTPKDHEIALRNCIEARQGWKILAIDWSQIELRIMAHFTQDKTLLDCFRGGGDFFRLLASAWKDVDPAAVNQRGRNQVKTMAYGLVYGMGNTALARKMNVEHDEAEVLRSELEARLGGYKEWKKTALASCKKYGYVETLGGRKRFFDFHNKSEDEVARNEREAINTVFQGSAADVLKATMLTLDRELVHEGLAEDCLLVLEVHDELVFEVREQVLPKAADLTSKVMREAAKMLRGVDLDVKIMVGRSWGDLQSFEGPFSAV